ncbi:hypothetical protein C5167_035284 [Papaver somniferum]|uniref:CBS domain-containing protein n=1 Tax=Papaver somniferum TaxID=3469 RepID=A0A4Y7KJQ4_PAPSO|nr:hypothetical protein C5167_035284 [Papaver somniferum]
MHRQRKKLARLLCCSNQQKQITRYNKITNRSVSEEDDSAGLAPINSLHRTILYPLNTLLLSQSSNFPISRFLSVSLRQVCWWKKDGLSKALTIAEGTTVSDACRRIVAGRVDAVLLTDANTLLSGIVTNKGSRQNPDPTVVPRCPKGQSNRCPPTALR